MVGVPLFVYRGWSGGTRLCLRITIFIIIQFKKVLIVLLKLFKLISVKSKTRSIYKVKLEEYRMYAINIFGTRWYMFMFNS